MECAKQHHMIKGCDFCIINMPCQCSVMTNDIYLPARLTSCHNHTKNMTVLHPFNIVLLQEFFDNSEIQNVLADTTYANPLNVTIPNFKMYRHKMRQVLADDSNAHLSLKKMADQAKQVSVIFQSLAEPLLDGQLNIQSEWPDSNAILIFVTMGTTIASSLLMFWTLRYSSPNKLNV